MVRCDFYAGKPTRIAIGRGEALQIETFLVPSFVQSECDQGPKRRDLLVGSGTQVDRHLHRYLHASNYLNMLAGL